MTNYTLSSLRVKVRSALDENTSEPLSLNTNIDTLSLDTLIDNNIPIAVRIVDSMAPVHMLGDGEDMDPSNINWIGDTDASGCKPGFVNLPNDFLRLISFQMTGWAQGVSKTINENDPLWKQQFSKYGGVRGNPQNPVVAITKTSAALSLFFFTAKYDPSPASILHKRYIPIPIVSGGSIKIPELLVDAAVYYCAYLIAKTLGQENLATHLLDTSTKLMTT